MIAHLKGVAIAVTDSYAVLDVSGVGYKVSATSLTLQPLREGMEVEFWTYLAVRETALDLYGFGTKAEESFFQLLITISGIGPKTALGILNVATIDVLRNAVLTENTAHLIKVSGIGKKNAEKIVLELRGKLDETEFDGAGARHDDSDALEALMSLGYTQKEAREALQEISQDVSGTSERVKQALKFLSS
jgi:Holliday junction DNA helicase RuvA